MKMANLLIKIPNLFIKWAYFFMKTKTKRKITKFLEKENKEVLLTNLPQDIMREILEKLPIRTIMRCKCVCKSWRDKIEATDFATFDKIHKLLHTIVFENNDMLFKSKHGQLFIYSKNTEPLVTYSFLRQFPSFRFHPNVVIYTPSSLPVDKGLHDAGMLTTKFEESLEIAKAVKEKKEQLYEKEKVVENKALKKKIEQLEGRIRGLQREHLRETRWLEFGCAFLKAATVLFGGLVCYDLSVARNIETNNCGCSGRN
ncbi:uncharacterized protein LOC125195497 [Salvia hispanica]|uniref:uncharacterized protein LOC125195497 n=1 Tax=Salvia hispanica TaxID=49212 RepID=UPI002009079F|nr:uncharacterized protein LOC125195497 [Salvia hispanica]